jgi:hypothetical protein
MVTICTSFLSTIQSLLLGTCHASLYNSHTARNDKEPVALALPAVIILCLMKVVRTRFFSEVFGYEYKYAVRRL